MIYTIKDGAVYEKGTFEELVEKRGHFFKMRKYQVILQKRQTLKNKKRPIIGQKDVFLEKSDFD